VALTIENGEMQLSAAKRNGEISSQRMNQNHQEIIMSTQLPVSQSTPISSDARSADTAIPVAMLAYFRGRFGNKIHELVLAEFAAQEREGKTSRAELARKIRRKPEQITRWLGSPGNWTLDTLSDLLLGMGLEPVVSARSLASVHVSNWGTAWHAFQAAGNAPLIVHVQSAQEVAQDMADGNHKPFYFTVGMTTGIPAVRAILPEASDESGNLAGFKVNTQQSYYLAKSLKG
jgi:hypothetical protein